MAAEMAERDGYTAVIEDVLNFPHEGTRSIIIKVQHNCSSDRKHYGKLGAPSIRHEYCVVFRKPAGEEVQAPPQSERCLNAPEGKT